MKTRRPEVVELVKKISREHPDWTIEKCQAVAKEQALSVQTGKNKEALPYMLRDQAIV